MLLRNQLVRKVSKRILQVLAAVLAIAVIAGFSCFEGVDYAPYFRTGYYKETMARLKVALETNQAGVGPLAAGFGKALLTPVIKAPEEDPAQGRFRFLPLAGYGGRKGRPAVGSKDDLWVKAVAIKSQSRLAVLIATDALIIPREITEIAVRRANSELGLQRDQLYFGATHTHASLGGWGEGFVAESFAGQYQPGVRTWFADRLVTAAREALADLKAASFGHGSFNAPVQVRNRVVGELGRVDPEFSYLCFRQEDGKNAVLGSFAAHATVLPSGNMQFSGDYPGAWQRAVEEGNGGMAAFFAGGVGSHSPRAGGNTFEHVESMGRALAVPTLEHLRNTVMTNLVSFQTLGLEVSLPSLHARVSDGVRLRPWLSGRLVPVKDKTFVQVLRLNDAIWISAPCDFSGELALDIKDTLFHRGFQATVTSFNGDYIGYIIPSRYYHLGGYEPRVMSFFGPTMPDYLEELMRTMAFGVTANVPNRTGP